MKSIPALDHNDFDPTRPARPRRALNRRGPAPLALEPRVMFDGATADAAVAAAKAAAAVPADLPAERSAAHPAVAQQDTHVAAAVLPADTPRQEIVFIEDNVPDYQKLAAAVQPGVEVVVLDHTKDGLQQMIAALDGHAPVDALHLVTHGAAGQVDLGSERLSVDNLDAHAGRLAALGTHLAAGGDILIYGCDVGQGDSGSGFVSRMAQFTGADVAASTDITGSKAFGGNWTLETRAGTVEAQAIELDRAGWQGELETTVFDAQQRQLSFQGGVLVARVGGLGDTSNPGTRTGDVVRFSNVITIGGQQINAEITTTLDRANITSYDFTDANSTASEIASFQPQMKVTQAGGGATFTVNFYTTSGAQATLQNVVVNSYDIDGVTNTSSDRQYQEFRGFAYYQSGSELKTQVQSDGSVRFQYDPASGTPTNNTDTRNNNYRVQVFYDSMNSFQIRTGAVAAASGTFNGTAYFYLDFELHDWGATKIASPAPKLSYANTTLTETDANNGAVMSTTITLSGSNAGGSAATFAGVNGQELDASFSNLPAGLTAHVTRTSATTAQLSFSGNALAHTDANDIGNFGVTFNNGAFTSNLASAVTGSSRADLGIDFNNPPPDTIAPVVAAGQAFAYTENRSAGAGAIGTVAAADDTGVTGFRFANAGATGGSATSADGWFAIDGSGNITLTANGRAAGAASNDYETGANSFTYAVQARDLAGNWSNATSVTLNLANVDDIAPTFTSGTTANPLENQPLLYTAAATDAVDFTNGAVTYGLKSGVGDAGLLSIDAGGAVRLAAGNLDFEAKRTYSFTVTARDDSGNQSERAVTVTVGDVDEIAPTVTIGAADGVIKAGGSKMLTFTFSEDVGTSFTQDDVTVDSGTIGPLTQLGPTSYTALYTPADGVAATDVQVRIAAGKVTDLAHNDNTAPASLTLAVDTAAPQIGGPGGAGGITSRLSVPEGTLALHTFTANESVTWSLAGGEDAERFTITPAGALAFRDAPDYELPQDGATNGRNTYLVQVRAVDAAGNASLQDVTVTVTNVNEVPVAADGAIVTAEDTAQTGMLPPAIDLDHDTVTYAKAGDPAHGTVRIDADGSYTYTPAADYNGSDSFRYSVSDGHGGSNTYTISVTVTPVNDAPVASGTRITAQEDTPVSGTLPVATDAENEPVIYAKAGDPAHGTVVITPAGGYTYTPAADYNGADSFTYTVSDGHGGSNTYTVEVTVNAGNDAPFAADTAIATAEDTAKRGTLPPATDLDHDTVTYAKAGDPAHGTVSIDADGSYIYTPTADYNGSDSFRYSVSDGHGGSNTYTVSVTVTPVNDAPLGAGTRITVAEDTPASGTLPVATDADRDAVTYARAGDPAHGTVVIDADGRYTYTPAANYNGADSFTYTVSDGHGGSNTYTVEVTVNPDNDAPVAADTAIVTAEGTVKRGTLPQATDLDHDTVTYAKAADPAHGTVSIDAGGSYVYTPAAHYNGSDSFTYTVSDGHGGSNTYTVDIDVTPVNDAPVAADSAITTVEDTVKTGTLPRATDVESDTVTYAKAGGPAHGTVSVDADGRYTYTPGANYNGADSFQYTVSDGHGGSNTYTVEVTVNPANDAPVAAGATIVTAEDTAATGTLPPATDIDRDTVTYAKAADPAHGTVGIGADGRYTYTPAANYFGTDRFTYTVSDGHGGSNTYTVDIDVTPVNDAPIAADSAITTREDTVKTGTLPGATDAERDTVTYARAGDPAHGTVRIDADGSYTYTPAANYSGADSFTYTVSDGHGGSNTHTVAVDVTPVNDVPVARDTAIATREDTPVSGNLPVASDADGDRVAYALAGAPVHGSVVIDADGRYTYTPAADYNGADSFRYSVADGKGGSNTYTVSVTIAAVNDAPVAHGGAAGNGTVGEPMAPLGVPAFTDVDGPALAYTATLADGSPLPSWLAFDPATRTFTGTPPRGSAGTHEVVVNGSDGASAATARVTIEVGNPRVPGQPLTIGSMDKDTGVSATDFITSDGSAGRTVSGSIGAPLGRNEAVQVSFDGGATWTTAATSGTTWSVTDNGAHTGNWTIEARVTNLAAGLDGTTATRAVVLDTVAPAAPTVNDLTTTSATPVLNGSANPAAGETLRVTINGATYEVAAANGSWSLDLASATPVSGTAAPLTVGRNYDVTATITDPAGNVGSGTNTGLVSVSPPLQAPVAAPLVQPAAPVAVAASAPTPVAEPTPVSQAADSRVRSESAPGSLAAGDSVQLGYGVGTRAAEQPVIDLRAAALSDIYTRTEGFRTVVAKAEEPALVLFQGVPDQFAESGHDLSMTIPADAFAHTQPNATVRLVAVQQDGRPLPAWVQFNGQTGQFTGDVPKGLQGELKIKLIARDLGGREAVALFRINVGQQRTGQQDGVQRSTGELRAPAGKAGLSAQLRARSMARG
ncbi:Ig-like domain-containing protein [Herbaspirillum sp. SJZ107]|uniref:Ig-like domain-containing protein n=1 Tax=Herbaspirillum sp. SJZ107 TaxID=2572881 RepID=UPI00114E4907|nr:Ig-like domain-containing protein [Herbaspirillum sp. SJZ107]TQK04776.1 VCBS repeat-containing protein [Herbaspirillum sp. SJZ107]